MQGLTGPDAKSLALIHPCPALGVKFVADGCLGPAVQSTGKLNITLINCNDRTRHILNTKSIIGYAITLEESQLREPGAARLLYMLWLQTRVSSNCSAVPQSSFLTC